MSAQNIRTDSYFATDGSYGSASGLVVADTTNWSSSMWALVEACSDDVRQELAEHFAKNDHQFELHHYGQTEPRCEWCSLSEEDLQES